MTCGCILARDVATPSYYNEGSGIAGNPGCVRVDTLVGGVQCWLVGTVCVCGVVVRWCVVIAEAG